MPTRENPLWNEMFRSSRTVGNTESIQYMLDTLYTPMEPDQTPDRCARCGSPVHGISAITTTGGKVFCCERCAESEGYLRCQECGEWVYQNKIKRVSVGGVIYRQICVKCFNEQYTKCPTCGNNTKRTSIENRTLADGTEIQVCARCSNTIPKCYICGTYHLRSKSHAIPDGRFICHECATVLNTCTTCGGKLIIPKPGESFPKVITHDGKVFCCSTCAQRGGYYYCERCRSWHKKSETRQVVDHGRKNRVCAACFEEQFELCPHCGLARHRSEMQEIEIKGGEHIKICESCIGNNYFYCNICHKWHPHAEMVPTTDGGYGCRECAKDLPQCPMCMSYVIEGEEAIRKTQLWGTMCEHCYLAKTSQYYRNLVKPWHWHKDDRNHNKKFLKVNGDNMSPNVRYFGVELETLCPTEKTRVKAGEMAAILTQLSQGHFYIETDGSLREESPDSFEIITEPFTLNYYKEKLEGLLSEVTETLKKHDWDSFFTQSCGLHFHVTRSTFSRETLAKLLMLTETKRSILYTLSGRNSLSDFDHYAGPNNIVNIREYVQAQYAPEKMRWLMEMINEGRFGNRHTALNLTNRSTIELRIFKGTLDMDMFNGCFDTLMALINMAETYTAYQAYKVGQRKFISDIRGYSDNTKKLCDLRGL